MNRLKLADKIFAHTLRFAHAFGNENNMFPMLVFTCCRPRPARYKTLCTKACGVLSTTMDVVKLRSPYALSLNGRRAMSGEPAPPCCEIRSISASTTQPLRQKVLRPDLTSVPYRGDERPDTAHFGAFLGDQLIGVASAFREPLAPPGGLPPQCSLAEAAATQDSWRIRGVAVDASLRGKGIGSKLINACIKYSIDTGGTCVWCVARCSAEIVYERLGFKRTGELFRLDGIGPVRYMVKRLTPNGN
ncbi:uncharacterized N-acetyltransferase YitI-like [Ornithodoros turicata]